MLLQLFFFNISPIFIPLSEVIEVMPTTANEDLPISPNVLGAAQSHSNMPQTADTESLTSGENDIIEEVVFEDSPPQVDKDVDMSMSQQTKRKRREERHDEKIDNFCDRFLIEEELEEDSNGKHSSYCDGTCHIGINVDKVYPVRVDIHRRKMGKGRMEKVIEIIRLTKTKQRKAHHLVEGVEVCKDYWCKVVAKIRPNTYRKALTLVNKGIVRLVTTKKKKKRPTLEDAALSYMNLEVQGISDFDPQTASKKLLAVGTKVKKIFHKYVEHETQAGMASLGYRRFCQIWHDNISPKVSFSTVGKIAVCDICVEYEYKTQRERDELKRAQLEMEWSKHKEKQL